MHSVYDGIGSNIFKRMTLRRLHRETIEIHKWRNYFSKQEVYDSIEYGSLRLNLFETKTGHEIKLKKHSSIPHVAIRAQ